MRKIEKITLIGAGGTGSMILPALVPSHDVEIYDGDVYEEKNITRQIYSANSIGDNKAVIMAKIFNNGHKNVTAIPKMITGNEKINSDLLICCVDNNNGRLAAQRLSDENETPLIITGNENWEPMAWLYLPEYKYTYNNPYKRWDLGNLKEGRQETCSGIKVIDENPQLPEANYCAGAHALTILYSIKTCMKERNYVAEVISTPWSQTKTIKEITLNNEK